MTLALALGLGVASAGSAQEDSATLEALDECTRLQDRDARLDCIDAVLAERNAQRTPEPTSEPAEPAPPPAVTRPAPAPAPSRTEPAGEPAPAASATAPRPSAAPAVETAPRSSRRERRAQRRAEREAAVRPITVVDVRVTIVGRSVLTTQDGQRWESIYTPERGYPEVPFEAAIEPGRSGSYFLRLPDTARRLRVSIID